MITPLYETEETKKLEIDSHSKLDRNKDTQKIIHSENIDNKHNNLSLNTSSEKIENLNINEEIQKTFNENENKDNNNNQSSVMNSIQSVSSIDSEEYLSAKSSMITNTMMSESLNISSALTDSLYSKVNENDSDNEDNEELHELYMKMKELISNEEYSMIKEIETRITNSEIENRKKKHEEKLKKLSELENSMTNSKGDYIKEEKNYKDDVLVLANINPDDGYAIVNRNELEKDYEIKQFKDYEYYIKRTRAVNVNSNLSSL